MSLHKMVHPMHHHRRGQPVQRRIPFRKARGTSDELTYGGEGVHVERTSLVSTQSPRDRGKNENDEEEDKECDEDTIVKLYSSLLAPTSVWHDIWCSIRYYNVLYILSYNVLGSSWYDSTFCMILIETAMFLHEEPWLFCRVLPEGACYILLSTLVGMVVAFFAVVRATHEVTTATTGTPPLETRRIPPLDEQLAMHDARVRGATKIYLAQRTVILQGSTAPQKGGHLRLPNQFYQGVHFGLSAWNKWGEKLSHEENDERNGDLRRELERLDPRPSAIYPTSFEDDTEGFTLAYLAGALGQHEGRSVRQRSDPVWLEAEKDVLATARSFQQLVITKWYPGVWGPGHEHDSDAHTSILQKVHPTRTGLRALASTVTVHEIHEIERAATATVKTSRPPLDGQKLKRAR